MMYLILQTVTSKNENSEYDVSNFPNCTKSNKKTTNMMFLILQDVTSKIENNEYDVSDPPNCNQ